MLLAKDCGKRQRRLRQERFRNERHVTRSKRLKRWGGRRESNPQPSEPQSGALPVELLPPDFSIITAALGVPYASQERQQCVHKVASAHRGISSATSAAP